MKNVRIEMTENEKRALDYANSPESKIFHMNEASIDNLIRKEKAAKFNDQVENYSMQLEANNAEYEKSVESLQYDINRAEIKPMFSRILVKPFKQNPFQKMIVSDSGLILDAGGYNPHTEKNPVSGKYEEQKEFIITGYVVEVGPEVKYLSEGDVIYYRVDTAVPVPFFKQGLYSLAENQIIAVVNEGLENRFKNVK